MRNIDHWLDADWDNYVDIEGNYEEARTIFSNYDGKTCDNNGKIAKDSMWCEFEIYSAGASNGNLIYRILWPCLSDKDYLDPAPEYSTHAIPALKAWYKKWK